MTFGVKEILLEDLVPLFEYKLTDAAKRLGISVSTLKRVCRKLGIPRWPYRKISSLHRKYRIKKDPKCLTRIEEIKANPSCLVKNRGSRMHLKIKSRIEIKHLLSHPTPKDFSLGFDSETIRLPSFRELCNMLEKHHILSE